MTGIKLACPESWPAKRGCSAWGADYGFHGCKFDPDHDGPHRCLCGRSKPASLRMTRDEADDGPEFAAPLRRHLRRHRIKRVPRARDPDHRVDFLVVCVCGEPATTTVEVQWVDRKRRYRYCDECADDVVFAIEGAEVLP